MIVVTPAQVGDWSLFTDFFTPAERRDAEAALRRGEPVVLTHGRVGRATPCDCRRTRRPGATPSTWPRSTSRSEVGSHPHAARACVVREAARSRCRPGDHPALGSDPVPRPAEPPRGDDGRLDRQAVPLRRAWLPDPQVDTGPALDPLRDGRRADARRHPDRRPSSRSRTPVPTWRRSRRSVPRRAPGAAWRRRTPSPSVLVGAVLGAAVGFIPGIAITYPLTRTFARVGPSHYLDIPWLQILALVVALPLLTALVVGLLARSRLPCRRPPRLNPESAHRRRHHPRSAAGGSAIRRTTRAGLPTARTPAGRSRVTTEPAPTTVSSADRDRRGTRPRLRRATRCRRW